MELAGTIFENKEIEQLPIGISNGIKENTSDSIFMVGQAYMKNQCHNNAILVAKEIKLEGAEVKIVEGLVKCDDGFLFEHFWNRLIVENQSCDLGVTLDVIGSEEERNTQKQYYEYKDYTLCEIEAYKSQSNDAFSIEVNNAVTEYYEGHPLAERYYNSKMQVNNKQASEALPRTPPLKKSAEVKVNIPIYNDYALWTFLAAKLIIYFDLPLFPPLPFFGANSKTVL